MSGPCEPEGFEGEPNVPRVRTHKRKPEKTYFVVAGPRGGLYIPAREANVKRNIYVRSVCTGRNGNLDKDVYETTFVKRILDNKENMQRFKKEMELRQKEEDESLKRVMEEFRRKMGEVKGEVHGPEKVRIDTVLRKIDDLDEQGQLSFATWLRDACRSHARGVPPYKPSGLKWKEDGTEKPSRGKSIPQEELASEIGTRAAVREREIAREGESSDAVKKAPITCSFLEEERTEFDIPDHSSLSFLDYVYVAERGTYFRPDEDPLWRSWPSSQKKKISGWKDAWFSAANEQLDALGKFDVQIEKLTCVTECFPCRIKAWDLLSFNTVQLETMLVEVTYREEGSEDYTYCFPYENLIDIKNDSDYTQEVNDRRRRTTASSDAEERTETGTHEYVYESTTRTIVNINFLPSPDDPAPSDDDWEREKRRSIPVCRTKRLVGLPKDYTGVV